MFLILLHVSREKNTEMIMDELEKERYDVE